MGCKSYQIAPRVGGICGSADMAPTNCGGLEELCIFPEERRVRLSLEGTPIILNQDSYPIKDYRRSDKPKEQVA